MAANPIRDFALDASGDMDCSSGRRHVVAGEAAVRQAVKIKVRLFLGEIFLDIEKGIDYLNRIFGKGQDPLDARELIRARILEVPDVTEVVGSNLIVGSGRRGSISYRMRTIYSTQPIDDTVEVP